MPRQRRDLESIRTVNAEQTTGVRGGLALPGNALAPILAPSIPPGCIERTVALSAPEPWEGGSAYEGSRATEPPRKPRRGKANRAGMTKR